MKKSLVLLAGMLLSPLALAEDVPYNMVSFDASATQDVVNDELITTLEVIEDGSDPTKLTDMVNKKSAMVLDAVKHFKDIKAETSNYHTQPLYNEGKIQSWKVTQQVTLETANFDEMSQLIADISSLANIQSMQFRVSDKQAEIIKRDLLNQAITNFRDKAKQITHQFEHNKYELVSLSVDGNNFSPMPVMDRAVYMSAQSSSKRAPAALSGGTNEISVQVRGTIQFQQ